MGMLLACLMFSCFCIQGILMDPDGNDVADAARSHVGETTWSYESPSGTGRNTYKCNQFVADVFDEVGLSVPQRRPGSSDRPIGAREWGNPYSVYLMLSYCWRSCSSPTNGDVIAEGGHVGIVTGHELTTSAATEEVVENDWGFRSGQSPTCWRYQYDSSWC